MDNFFGIFFSWLSLTTLTLLFLQVLKNRNNPRLPPGPRPLPIIGNLLELGDLPYRSLASLAKTHGPLMSLRLGSVLTVVASSPDIARDVLQKHDADVSARFVPDAVSANGQNDFSVGWLPPNRRWRSLRKICSTELFTTHGLDALQSLRQEKVQQLVSYIRKVSTKAEPVDIRRVVFTTSLNILSSTIFSVDLVELECTSASQEFLDVITAILELAACPNVSDFFPVLAKADLQGVRRRMSELFGRMHAVFDKQIDKRVGDRSAGLPAKQDFLDVLLDSRMDDGSEMDRDTIKGVFMDLFVAGSETSTVTMEWVMAELLQNPKSMEKARNEIQKVIGTRKVIQESDIRRLPYLQAIVKETLRIHPAGAFPLPRQVEKQVEIAGYTLPKGTRLLINLWAMSHNEDTWPDPEKFIPERFLEKEINYHSGDFGFIPFGGGRRVCPGLPLATRMMHLILASLLHQFEWKLPEDLEKTGVDMREKFGLTVALAVPLQAMAVPV